MIHRCPLQILSSQSPGSGATVLTDVAQLSKAFSSCSMCFAFMRYNALVSTLTWKAVAKCGLFYCSACMACTSDMGSVYNLKGVFSTQLLKALRRKHTSAHINLLPVWAFVEGHVTFACVRMHG